MLDLFLLPFFSPSEFTSLPISMNLYHFPKLLLCSFVVDMCSLFFFNPPFVVVLITKSSPTLCDRMGRSPLVSSVHGISPGKNARVGYQFLLQRTFPPKESNPHLLHCRWIHYHWETQKSSRYFYLETVPPFLPPCYLVRLSEAAFLSGDRRGHVTGYPTRYPNPLETMIKQRADT